MAHAHQATPARTRVAIVLAAILVAVPVTAATLAIGSFRLPGSDAPAQAGAPNPALLWAEQEWERQRLQQSGWTDPMIEAGREWQRQRDQQNPFTGERPE